jgi:putative MATE family efflux protein
MNLAVDSKLGKRIVGLAGPVILAMLSQSAINVVDHILVGRLPAEESIPGQAAIGISLVLMWAVGGCLSAISVGTQALTARRTGEQEHLAAGQVMFNSLIVAAITSGIASVVGWFVVPHIFGFFSPSHAVVSAGIPYLQWRFVGIITMVTTISYKSWFDGLGHTRVHMFAAVVMNIINFFLNIALVFGVWGFPRWGVTGSAIASMISSYIGLFIMMGVSLTRAYRGEYQVYHLKNLSMRQQWELVKLSAPSGLATVFVMSGFGLFYKIAGLLASSAAIDQAATENVIMLLIMFFSGSMAYGSATATLVGQSMGAKDYSMAERYAWEAVKLGVYVSLVLGSLILIFPDTVLHALTKDEMVIAVARPIVRICGGLLPVVLSAIVLTQALFGAGNTKYVMFVEFGLHFFCLVPLAYICGVRLGWGVVGVWTGAFVYIVLLCALMGWKFAEGRWKEIRI